MARTPQQIFQHHAGALVAGDMDQFMSDYGDDSVLITAGGAVHGKSQIRDAFNGVLELLPNPAWDLHTRIFEGNVLFLGWKVASDTYRMEGVDTFVFGEDGIRVHTVHFVVEQAA
jgi:ketosteroid isomerase-like protein